MRRLILAALVLAGAAARGQVVSNGSFEVDAFAVAPGSVASNAAISGWSVSHPERSGLNPAGGTNDFANNGAVPAGTNVAWLQSEALVTSVLSQAVSGFTPGQAYKIAMRVNAKTGTTPRFQIGFDGVASVTGEVTAVGGTTAYRYLATVLNATAATHSIEIANLTGANTNSILLVDDVSVSAGAGNWSLFNWSDDASSGISATNTYTHAFNFGAAGQVANTTINGVLFTAVTGANPVVAGSFSSVGLTMTSTDAGNAITLAGGASSNLMKSFVYNQDLQSLTLSGLTPGVAYMFTVYSVGFETNSRSATFENGTDRLTVNQDQFGNDSGIAIQHRYVAPISGTITLSWRALKAGTTIHVYGFSNRTAGDTAPLVSVSPRDRIAAPGSLSTFRALTGSTLPMDHQWLKAGADLANETNATLTVGPVSASDIAGYSLRVSNVLGVATSAVANLTFGPISNPSFESDIFTVAPGFISSNAPIIGWTSTTTNRVGVNPLLDGQQTFLSNGAIPNGAQVAFMQSLGATSDLSTVLGGLTIGQAYTLGFRFNARTATKPVLRVSLDGATSVDMKVSAVGGTAPYHYGAVDFTASGTSATLLLLNDNTSDSTVLIDAFSATPSPGTIGYSAWTGDSSAGLSTNTRVTHAFKFNSAQNTTINNFNFTGVAGTNPTVLGRFSTAGFPSLVANDVNNITALGGGSAILARDFVYGGSNQILVVTGLVPGVEYEASLYSVAWDLKAYGRAFTVTADGFRQTINQDHYDNNNGIRITARYVATTNGTGTITLTPTDSATTLHLYGFMNREVLSTNAPSIYVQPSTTNITTVVGEVIANNQILVGGAEPLAFQWYRDGIVVTGQTERVLNLTATSTADSGDYTLVVTNIHGAITSAVIAVDVGIPAPNWSFEAEDYAIGNGYQTENGGIITGWTFPDPTNRLGLNPAAASPFANNGVIPNGAQVAFIQEDTTLSTTITGLTTGEIYYLRYHVNARNGFPAPTVAVSMDGLILDPTTVVNTGAYVARSSTSFIATNDTITVTFTKGQGPVIGDSTLLLDAVSLRLSDATAPAIAIQPVASTIVLEGSPVSLNAAANGTLPLTYQWRRNGTDLPGETNLNLIFNPALLANSGTYAFLASNTFGTATSQPAQVTIGTSLAGLFNTGLDDNRLPLSGGAVDPHYRITSSSDILYPGPDALALANVYPIPPYMLNTTNSVWISAATNPASLAGGSYTFATTFLVDEHDSAQTVILGNLAVDNAVTNILLNGSPRPINAAGFGAWSAFTLTNGFVPGLNTLAFQVRNDSAGPCAFRAELTGIGVPTTGQAPAIVNNPPALTEAQPGTNLRLTAGATGSAELFYQWYFNTNTLLAGATNHWLALNALTETDEGHYTLRVTNTLGTATSAAAQLIILGPLPLFIGGGGANLIFRWQETSEPWALFETDDLLADPVIWSNSGAPISNVPPWKIITIPPTNALKYYRLEIVPSS